MPFLSPNQQCQSTEGKKGQNECITQYNTIPERESYNELWTYRWHLGRRNRLTGCSETDQRSPVSPSSPLNVNYNEQFTTRTLAAASAWFAPCWLPGCKNRPAPFPGWMSYTSTKFLYLRWRHNRAPNLEPRFWVNFVPVWGRIASPTMHRFGRCFRYRTRCVL